MINARQTNGGSPKNHLILTCGPGLTATPHGDVVVLDWDSKSVVDSHRFTHEVYPNSHKGLAGASWCDGKLLVATECELLEFAVDPLRLVDRRSFPFLNDVHHLAARNGTIWVCNTGLDCVEVFNSNWEFQETHDLLGPVPRRLRYSYTSLRYTLKRAYDRIRGWRPAYAHLPDSPRFPNTRKLMMRNAFRRDDRDWRFSLFRPHILHPNHILALENDVWVTINTTGEIVSLCTGRIIASGFGRRIHDGIVADNEHYVTNAMTNHIIVHEFRPEGPSLGRKIHDTCVADRDEGGFLRGIDAAGDLVFAGLTVRRGWQDRQARILALDRRTLQPVDEWIVPDEFGKNIFTVLHAAGAYQTQRTC